MRQSREECHAGICSLIRILEPIKIFQYVRLQFIWGIIHTRRLSSHYLMRTKKKFISPITIQYEMLSHMICTEFPKHGVNVTAVSEYCICTARNEVWGKIMFLHLSVILFTRGGGCLPHYILGYTPLLGRYSPRQTPLTDTPSRILWDMVNKREVHILLECILVMCAFVLS